MSDKPRQSADLENNSDTSQGPKQHKGSVSRRQLLKSAIVTGPVILTVTSRPAWALKPKNCTDSAVMSLNPSGREPCEANEGCSPGFWGQHQDIWSAATGGEYPPGRSFFDVFGRNAFGTNNGGFTSISIGEVILLKKAQGQDNGDLDKVFLPAGCNNGNANQVKNKKNLLIQLGFHSVAALLNAASSVDYGFNGVPATPMDVILLFQAAYDSCDFEPTKDMLDIANNQYCPLDAFGRPT